MKEMNNCNANNNADNQFVNVKKHREKKQDFKLSVEPSSESWDPTPDTADEMVNTYGTYEIQATADTKNRFPAISQGLPSESVAHTPDHFDEGLMPELNNRKHRIQWDTKNKTK